MKSLAFSIALCVGFSAAAVAAPQSDSGQVDVVTSAQQATASNANLMNRTLHSALTNRARDLFVFGIDSELASNDGEYLAQNKLELQTYYDLGMNYRYLGDPLLRRQLALPQKQGIMIEKVKPDGQGDKNGLKTGDIVLMVDNTPVDTQYDLVIALTQDRGKKRTAKVKRDGNLQLLSVNLPKTIAVETYFNQRWILGVNAQSISDAMQAQLGSPGLLIVGLTEDGPAKAAGLQVHDVIVRVAGSAVANLKDLRAILAKSKGEKVKIDFRRSAKLYSLTLKPKAQKLPTTYAPVPVLKNVPMVQKLYMPKLELNLQPQVPGRLRQLNIQPSFTVQGNLQANSANNTGKSSKTTSVNAALKQIEVMEAQLKKLKSLLKKQ